MNAAVKIEKNIPVPPVERSRKHFTYPFAVLGIGESFLADVQTRNRIMAAANSASRRYGKQYVCRTRHFDRDGETGIRVWRIS